MVETPRRYRLLDRGRLRVRSDHRPVPAAAARRAPARRHPNGDHAIFAGILDVISPSAADPHPAFHSPIIGRGKDPASRPTGVLDLSAECIERGASPDETLRPSPPRSRATGRSDCIPTRCVIVIEFISFFPFLNLSKIVFKLRIEPRAVELICAVFFSFNLLLVIIGFFGIPHPA